MNDLERVNEALKMLSEHFDSVQIFTTRYDSSDVGTINIHKGIGNWYTRYGQVKEWCVREDEHSSCNIRKNFNEDSQ